MQSLTWYVYRLRRMSPAELCYRFVQTTRAHAARVAKAPAVPAPTLTSAPTFIHTDADFVAADYVAEAQRIIDGHYSLFDLEGRDLGHPPQWNRDPLTGRVAPLQHAATLDYRDERLVGNIKYLWEPSRHLHVPTLAQAYALTGDARYAEALRLHVDSWIEQCPPERGAHWTSSLELAIRLINWGLAWQLLGGQASPLFADADGRAFRARWLDSVYLQTRAITRKLSRFSSANNHLIGETAGVWIAALTWNAWPEMRRWGERCKAILETEVLRQNGADGANREQAFSYQQFVLDFALLAGLAARAAQRDFSKDYWRRLEAMVDFIASMMDVSGNVPMVGDADDGYVVRLASREAGAWGVGRGSDPTSGFSPLAQVPSPKSQVHECNYRSLVATGAVLFDRADLATKAGRFDDKSAWLLGVEGQRTFDALLSKRARYAPVRSFDEAGYYVLGSSFDTQDEIRLLVDAGALGYLSIAAHGHADALSLVLNVGGKEVLVDPGTYAYHTAPQWRRYFRSTRAHNTVLVDSRDQSEQSGNFMWSRHAHARCLEFSGAGDTQRFVGLHDGYQGLRDPVAHRREITFDAALSRFTIIDMLDCASRHTVRLHWHCAEQLQPIATDKEVCVHTDRHRVRIVAEKAPDRVLKFRGGTAEEGGWVSRGFGRKEPATTVAWESTIEGPTEINTYICIDVDA